MAFQCKRYKGSVPVSDIRDFRGLLTTDVEKAIFITTGSFPQSVQNEAKSAGKVQIDLIDGEQLIDRLAECRMGLTPKIEYDVDENYFKNI